MDQLQRRLDFRNVASILPLIRATSQKNYSISTSDVEPIIDLGNTVTIDKSERSTIPLTLPNNFGDVVHVDILYGANTAHGGVKYALYLVDRATRYKSIYPLTNLSSDILKQFKTYCSDMDQTPKQFICDCDRRLFSEEIKFCLEENNSKINAAPGAKQRQNGLAERTWRSVLRMARSWIASSMLPPTFWWFTFKLAVEVSNYIPLKLNSKHTTPHELVVKKQPNLQNLLPMFSVCYVRRKPNENGEKLKNIESHSIAVILVGRSTTANSPVFFHPHTKKLITTDDYMVDESIAAGPAFDIAYSGGLYFNSYAEQNVYLKPPTFKPSQTVYVKIKEVFYEAEIITLPTREDNVYTVRMHADSSIHQNLEKDILDVNPYIELDNNH